MDYQMVACDFPSVWVWHTTWCTPVNLTQVLEQTLSCINITTCNSEIFIALYSNQRSLRIVDSNFGDFASLLLVCRSSHKVAGDFARIFRSSKDRSLKLQNNPKHGASTRALNEGALNVEVTKPFSDRHKRCQIRPTALMEWPTMATRRS